MPQEKEMFCESCEAYSVKTKMCAEIWETWDGETERWGYEYVCPKCGRKER